MSAQGVKGFDYQGKLTIEWLQLDPSFINRISIQIAKDSLFTHDYHHFILPNLLGINSVSLALSSGPWFFRIGSWNVNDSDVKWSGIYGPLSISTQRTMIPSDKGTLKAIHTQPIDGGLRVFTGRNDTYSTLIEFTYEPTFNINKMKYRWVRDVKCLGQVDILGLEPSYTYNIRFAEIEESINSIVEPKEWIVLKGRRSMPQRRVLNNEDHASYKAEKVLLEEARSRTPRFSSGTDYANWLAIQEKAKARLQRE